MNMESLYDYGSRAGFWRLHRMFTERNVPATVYAVGMALEKNPDVGKAMVDAGWEVRRTMIAPFHLN
jgi:peptidoglycan/xylan/chitin deacetylase (PgdA/CDA1 family)